MKSLLEMTAEERQVNCMSFTELYILIASHSELTEFAEEVIKARMSSNP